MATIEKLSIETGRLQTDVDNLNARVASLRAKGSDMMSGIDALSAMWEGEAKNTFVTQFASDYQQLQKLIDAIENLIGDLQNAKEQYDKCENEVGTIISAIKV